MKIILPAFIIGLLIATLWLTPKIIRRAKRLSTSRELRDLKSNPILNPDVPPSPKWWQLAHRRIVGLAILWYGIYLAALTGTATHFVVPGLGAIGGGAAAGAGIGLATYFVFGTVGAVTGGAGIALGLIAMTVIGSGVGAAGGAAGGFGFKTVSYPLVSPWFWAPIVVIGIYLVLGRSKGKQK